MTRSGQFQEENRKSTSRLTTIFDAERGRLWVKRRRFQFFKQALGERLRLHLTQAQLAEDVDISGTYLGAIERGERSLTLDTLVRLVNRLGVTVDYLLADSVPDTDANFTDQFKRIINGQPMERKQMAIDVLRAMFAYFNDGEGA